MRCFARSIQPGNTLSSLISVLPVLNFRAVFAPQFVHRHCEKLHQERPSVIRVSLLLAVISIFVVTASQAEAKCPAFPEVSWWGKLNHGAVKGYVQRKHGGTWAGYLDKWQRQLSKIKAIHGQGHGIKVPSTGTILKNQQLAAYITQLEQRVKINQCLSQEKDAVKATLQRKTKVRKIVTTPYGEGIYAYRSGNYKAAHEIWLPIAQAGNPKAQNALGHLYQKGQGVDVDIDKSRHWFGRSADAGNPGGMLGFAQIGIETATSSYDMEMAIILIERAARLNYARAQYTLAVFYSNGQVVTASPVKAFYWATLAKKNNFKKAHSVLQQLDTILSVDDKRAQVELAENWLSHFGS